MKIKGISFILLSLLCFNCSPKSNSSSYCSLIKIDAKEATCTEDGNKECYYCSDTGKYYCDKEGLVEIDSFPLIPRKGHLETKTYYYDENKHYKERLCEHYEVEYESHSFIDGKCSVCGYMVDKPNLIPVEYLEYKVSKSYQKLITSDDYNIFSNSVINISKGGSYLLKDCVLSSINISANDVVLLFDSVSIKTIEVSDCIKNLNIILIDDANNICEGPLISFDGTLIINGKGTLTINNYSEKPSIESKETFISDSNIIINTNGEGLSSSQHIYISSASLSITTESEFVSNTPENKEKYSLVEEDYVYKKSGTVFGKKSGIYKDYALIHNTKGIHIFGNENYYNNHPSQYNDYGIYIIDSNIMINSFDDSIYSEYGFVSIDNSSLDITSKTNAIEADTIVNIDSSTLLIKYAYEGIESPQIQLLNSNIDIKSRDDSIEATIFKEKKGNLIIDGGTIICYSEVDDGIDAAQYVYVKSGTIRTYGASNGEGFDCDEGVIIDGGVVTSLSSYSSSVFQTNSKQPIIEIGSATVLFENNTLFSLYDSNNELVISRRDNSYYGHIVFSSPNMVIGNAYSFYANSELLLSFTLSHIVNSFEVSI